jgi:ribosomal protein S17E
MNFKEMWKENNRIAGYTRKFYKNYWRENSVVCIGALVVIYGGMFAVQKINEVKSKRINKRGEDYLNEKES